jgi:hypothetical protein
MQVPIALTAAIVTSAAMLTACSSGSTSTPASRPATPTASQAAAPSGAVTTAAKATSRPSSAAGGSADIDACSLLSTARASSLVGKHYTAAAPKTIAAGQDQCTYNAANFGSDLTVIVYQPDGGVTMSMLKTVQAGAGKVTNLSGIGDAAIIGPLELDAQVGTKLIAIEGAGGTLIGDNTKAIAVAHAVISALH